jgi:hypothetical protein
MNANELADIQAFETDELTMWIRHETATMLRQQQAEIEALKQIIDANNLNQNIGQFVKPTNEPVAWMYEKPNGASKLSFVKEKMLWEDMTETPLYTHPVKEQDESFDRTASHMAGEYVSYKAELTDEEIMQMLKLGLDEFRSILRKAQEK